MEIQVYNQESQVVGNIQLPDAVFAVPMNRDLLYQVATSQQANQRQVIAHAKGRSEVHGGGRKPWQQKGTGRARHGSIRSPIWKGGGVTHGPTKERIFKKTINRKMAKKALAVALSEKARQGQLAVVDRLDLTEAKTKIMNGIMHKLMPVFGGSAKSPNVLIVLPNHDKQVLRASKNIQKVGVTQARELNLLNVLSFKNLLILKDSIAALSKQEQS